MTEAELRHHDQTALWHPFTQMSEYAGETPAPPIIVGAEGNFLIDIHGRRYLDANCGYWCLALGCRPAAVENAVHAQLARFSHSTLLGISHEPAIALAKRLVELAGPPFGHVFFADSGSEAVEAALKMAYQYWQHKGQSRKSEFLALGEAYHGDTLGAVAVGGVDLFHAAFKPLLFPRAPRPAIALLPLPMGQKPESCALECAQAMEAAIEAHHETLAAVLIEPFILGPGGVIPQPAGYVERVLAAAKRFGVLAIFDEVAVGMGRLGSLFAFQQMDAQKYGGNESGVPFRPDIVCMAKGLTAGLLPLSAIMAAEHVYDAFQGTVADRKTFFHGHTFTGSALGCAAALAALDEFTRPGFFETLNQHTIPAFWKMLNSLRTHPNAGNVRGRGMMAGIEVRKANGSDYDWTERAGHKVVLAARERGVNLRAIGNLVLAVPPLTIQEDEIELLGRVLIESVSSISKC